jgi:hypothetical protein
MIDGAFALYITQFVTAGSIIGVKNVTAEKSVRQRDQKVR